MRQGPNKRSRGGRANGRRAHFNGRGSLVESSGAETKIKGTLSQVLERYQALARDAMSAGDRIAAENYLQHADHYYRLLQAQAGNGQQGQHGQHGHHGPMGANPNSTGAAPAPRFGDGDPFADADPGEDGGPGSDLPTA